MTPLPPPPPKRAGEVARRVLVLEDGAVWAGFGDASAMLLAPSARVLIDVRPDGTWARRRTAVELAHRGGARAERAAAVLRFRNALTDLGVVPLPASGAPDAESAVWAAVGGAADETGVEVGADGAVRVASACGQAALELAPHGEVARATASGGASWVFPARGCPPRWRHALVLARCAAAGHAPGTGGAPGVRAPLPPRVSLDGGGPAAEAGELPAAPGWVRVLHGVDGALPPGRVAVAEWRPAFTAWLVPAAGGRGGAPAAVALVHADESCLVSDHGGEGLWHRFCAGGAQPRYYAAGAVPRRHGEAYELAPVAAAALALARHARSAAADEPAAAAPGPPPVSDSVVEELHVRGSGRFAAFADGRVRARFWDRTVLDLRGPGLASGRALLPSGEAVELGTAAPPPAALAWHLEQARLFGAWAHTPRAERARLQRVRAAAAGVAAAEAEATARLIKVHNMNA